MNVQSNCLFVLWLLLYLTKTSGNYNKPTSHLSWEKPKRLHFAQSWCNFNLLWQLTRLSWESCHSKLNNKNKKNIQRQACKHCFGCAKKCVGLQTTIFEFSFSVRAQRKKMDCIITKLSLISWTMFLFICSQQLKEQWIECLLKMEGRVKIGKIYT